MHPILSPGVRMFSDKGLAGVPTVGTKSFIFLQFSPTPQKITERVL